MMQFVYATSFTPDILQKCRAIIRILSNADSSVAELCSPSKGDKQLLLSQVDEALCSTANSLKYPVHGKLKHSRGRIYETVEEFEEHVEEVLEDFRDANSDDPAVYSLAERLLALFQQLWSQVGVIQLDMSQLPPPPWDSGDASTVDSKAADDDSEDSNDSEDSEDSDDSSSNDSDDEDDDDDENSNSGTEDEQTSDDESSTAESSDEREVANRYMDVEDDDEDEDEESDEEDEDFKPRSARKKPALKSKSTKQQRQKQKQKQRQKKPVKKSRTSTRKIKGRPSQNLVHKSYLEESEAGKNEEWKLHHAKLVELAEWVEKISDGAKNLDGWRVEVHKKSKGSRKGSLDVSFVSKSGRKLRTRREVATVLEIQIVNEYSREESWREAFGNLLRHIEDPDDINENVPCEVTLRNIFKFKWVSVLGLGMISDKPGFHSKEAIFPVGYASTCTFISRNSIRKTGTYRNEILDLDGQDGPTFRVTDDRGFIFEGKSTADVWNQVIEAYLERYKAQCKNMALAVSVSENCSMAGSTPALLNEENAGDSEKVQFDLIYREVKRMMIGLITRVQNRVVREEKGEITVLKKPRHSVVKKSKSSAKKSLELPKGRSLAAHTRSISLGDLVKAGVVRPGPKMLFLKYQQAQFKADIEPNGMIKYEGAQYDTPSAFSIAMKRSINPNKMADDGWKSCVYKGTTLDKIKKNFVLEKIRKENEGEEEEDVIEDKQDDNEIQAEDVAEDEEIEREDNLGDDLPLTDDNNWWEISLQGLLSGKMGDFFYGLDQPDVLDCIEGLPGVYNCCPTYLFRCQRGSKTRDNSRLLRYHGLYSNRLSKSINKFKKHQDAVERRVEAANRRHMKLEDRFARNWRTLEKRHIKQKSQAIVSKLEKGTVAKGRAGTALEALETLKDDIEHHRLANGDAITDKERKELDDLEVQLFESQKLDDDLKEQLVNLEEEINRTKAIENTKESVAELKRLRSEASKLKERITENKVKLTELDKRLYDAVNNLRYRNERDSKRLYMKRSLRNMSDRITAVGRSLGSYVQRHLPADLMDDLDLEGSAIQPFPQELMKPLQMSENNDVILAVWAFVTSFAPLLGLCEEPELEIGIFPPGTSDEEREKMLQRAKNEVERNEVERKKEEAERKRLRQIRIEMRAKKSTTRKRRKGKKRAKVENGDLKSQNDAEESKTEGDEATESEDDAEEDEELDDNDGGDGVDEEEDEDVEEGDENDEDEEDEEEEEEEDDEEEEEGEEEEDVDMEEDAESISKKTSKRGRKNGDSQVLKRAKSQKLKYVESLGRRPMLMLKELSDALDRSDMHFLSELHIGLVRLLFSERKHKEDATNADQTIGYRDIPVNAVTWPELVRFACMMRLEQYVDFPDGSYVTNETEDLINRPSVAYSNNVLRDIDLSRIDSAQKGSKRKSKNYVKPLDPEDEIEGRHRKEVNELIMQSVRARFDRITVQPYQASKYNNGHLVQDLQATEPKLHSLPMTAEEIHACRAITREIALDDMALAFCCPVDTEQFTDYLDYINSPIDLQTIDVKLKANAYDNLEEFCSDMRLVWSNCKTYNSQGSEIYEIAVRLANYFEELLFLWLLRPFRGATNPPKLRTKTFGRAKKMREIPNPWSKELPLAPWESEENKDLLSIVAPMTPRPSRSVKVEESGPKDQERIDHTKLHAMSFETDDKIKMKREEEKNENEFVMSNPEAISDMRLYGREQPSRKAKMDGKFITTDPFVGKRIRLQKYPGSSDYLGYIVLSKSATKPIWRVQVENNMLEPIEITEAQLHDGLAIQENEKKKLNDENGILFDTNDQYIGSVVAKVLPNFAEAFEGVVVARHSDKFVVRFHVMEEEEVISFAELQETEAATAKINHEAEEVEDSKTPKSSSSKFSPKSSLKTVTLEDVESVEQVSNESQMQFNPDDDPVAPGRKNESPDDRVKSLLNQLVSKSYEELAYETKLQLLYFLCQEVSETNALREVIDERMSIVVQTRKTWRTNPPIIVKRANPIEEDVEKEKYDHETENWTHLPGDKIADELSGSGELELYQIKNELQSFRNDKSISLTQPLEKAMDRVEREIIDQYKRKDRKLQYKRWKAELEFKVQLFMPRSKLLGMDRFYNRYIHFPDDCCRIFVQPAKDPRYNEMPHQNSLDQWRVLDDRSSISTFLRYLNPKGKREAVLLNSIRSYAPILTRGRNWSSDLENQVRDTDLESAVFKYLRENKEQENETFEFFVTAQSSSILGTRVLDHHCELVKQHEQTLPEYLKYALRSLKVILLNIEFICFNANIDDWMQNRRIAWLTLVVETTSWRDLRQACAYLEDSFGDDVRVQAGYLKCYGEAAAALRCKTLSALACRVLALDSNIVYAPLLKRHDTNDASRKRKEAPVKHAKKSKKKK